MSRFGVLRNLLGVAEKEGCPKDSLRDLATGALFSNSESLFFKRLGESLADPEKRERVLSIFGAHDTEPFPLAEILKTSVRFADIKNDVAGKISEKEIDFLNLSIAFIENWFFKSGWTHIPDEHERHENAFAYFSVPAGVLNALTKFKEMPQYNREIRSIDKKRLTALCDSALKYTLGEYAGVVSEKKLLQLERSYKSVIHELSATGNLAGDLYFLKTCLVAAHMASAYDNEEMPLWSTHLTDDSNLYVGYDFSEGKDRYSSVHYPTERLPFALALVDYLKEKSGV